jgi:3-oxoacyl-[acyl-carrier protein] reductase
VINNSLVTRPRAAPSNDTISGRLTMDLHLSGKIALVAGASKGLGFAVARALAADGAVVSISSRDEKAIADAAARIARETGATIMSTPVDVRSGEAIARWVEATADRFGGIDALMTNSGGPPAGAAIAFDDAAWQEAAELLLFSAIRLVRAAVPHMQARGGGAILMSTSSSVKEPIQNLGLSTVLRASVSALAKTLAIELAPSKIRVNQIIPGRIDTDRVRQLDEINSKTQGITAAQARARSAGAIPLGRYGEADEFGRVGAFLLSDAASYMTGATVQVDGGASRSVL